MRRREAVTRALALSAAILVALSASAAVRGAYLRPAPKPLMDVWPVASYVGKPIQFRALAENAHRPIIGGSWDFGDGTMSADISTAQHSYAAPGTYTVVLTLIDQDGQKGQATQSVTVSADLPPVAKIVITPQPVEAGDFVNFSAALTTDEADDLYLLPLTYTWDVTGPQSFTGSANGIARTVSMPGDYTVELTVTDSNGSVAVATKTLTVVADGAYANGPPEPWISATGDIGAVAGRDAIAFDASDSTDPGGPIASYAWDFGDGSAATGVTASHTYALPGEYLVTLTVTDADARTAKAFFPVVVEPGALAMVASGSRVTGAAITFDATDSYVVGTGIRYVWVFGDGWWAAGDVATHTYVLPGNYSVDLYAVEDDEAVLIITELIVVAAGVPPVVTSGTTPATAATATTTTAPSAPAVTSAPVVGPPSTRLDVPTASTPEPEGRTVAGTRAAERITGTPYADRLSGGAGNDTLVGGAGRDVIDAGPGNDVVDARDGEVDTIRCGAGRDTVRADKADRVAKDCEKVRRS